MRAGMSELLIYAVFPEKVHTSGGSKNQVPIFTLSITKQVYMGSLEICMHYPP